MEEKNIPDDIDYESVHALKKEAVIKLGKIRPATIGQASRIPGITPGGYSASACLFEETEQINSIRVTFSA